MQPTFSRLLATVISVFALGIVSPLIGQEIDEDFYRDKIKPILSNHCYTCHGPDANTRKGGFRIDTKDGAFSEARSGEVPIAPGDLEASELVLRIHADDYSQMPPSDQERQLSPEDKILLEQWIAAGAPWKEHWAFESLQPVQAPEFAPESGSEWIKNEIDRFILSRLNEHSLTPSQEAERAVLLRRLSLDLTGLPPSTDELAEFMNDDREDAYEKWVDRLLASPHYGEHMATAWLDAARFADTNGYQNDFSRTMWPWRDWVIKAYNDNMPYDQFTIEQIAGDMLPNATDQQKIASGFNRNNRSVTEGGSIEEEWHVENVVDRVETTSTVFLGLTMGCARCHDHKYDPISQREFYEFFAYFNSSADRGVYNEKRGNAGPTLKVMDADQQARLEALDVVIASADEELKALEKSVGQRQREWEDRFVELDFEVPRDSVAEFFVEATPRLTTVNQAEVKTSPAPFRVEENDVHAIELKSGENAYVDLQQQLSFDGEKEFSISVWVKPTEFGAILSRMGEPEEQYRGFDMLLNANGRLSVHLIHNWPNNAIKVTTQTPLPANVWSNVIVTYDASKKAKGMRIYFDGVEKDVDVNTDSLAGTTLTDHSLWIGARTHAASYAGKIAVLKKFDRVLSERERLALVSMPVQSIAAVGAAERTDEQAEFLSRKFRSRFSTSEVSSLKLLEDLRKAKKQILQKVPTTMVMQELDAPRKTYLLNRGQYDQPDKSVELQPGIPKFLPQPEAELPANRLGLAKWLVAEENPLTSRVAVNRIWQDFFGQSLLDTPENFGVQSPTPTHPALLDYLANDFVQSGWNVKALQKKIVMSATYRQTSRVTVEQLSQDPTNRWLGRGARFRLSAETIRDNALAISGLLNRNIGGASIKPYQPAGVWKDLAGGAGEKPYVQDTDLNLYRRSLYIYRKRTVPHPTMYTFDAGSREICQVARQRTNTPLQALALLNDETYVEAARALAGHCLSECAEPSEQISLAFKKSMMRNPNADELRILKAAFERYHQFFSENKSNADEFLAVGEAAVPADLDRTQLAAMVAVCSTILNLDETITRE